jgi:hypothetical protein
LVSQSSNAKRAFDTFSRPGHEDVSLRGWHIIFDVFRVLTLTTLLSGFLKMAGTQMVQYNICSLVLLMAIFDLVLITAAYFFSTGYTDSPTVYRTPFSVLCFGTILGHSSSIVSNPN